MKKRIISIMILLSFLLIGCAQKKPPLLTAIEKMQSITAMHTSTEITFNLKVDNIDDEESEEFLAMFNKATIKYEHSFNTDTKLNQQQTKTVVSVVADEFDFNTNIYTENDLTNESVKLILEVPEIFDELVSFLSFDKKYLTIELEKMIEEDSDIDLEAVLKKQRESHAQMMKLAQKVEKKLKPNFKIIEPLKQADSQFEAYRFHLDDATLKQLIIDFYEVLTTDKETKDLFELDDAPSLEEIKENLNKTQILGPNGVNIDYYINKDGYVAQIIGSIDILMDSEDNEDNESIGLEINFKTINSRFNDPNLNIEFPNLTEENSMALDELFNMDDFGGLDDFEDYDNFNDSYFEAFNLIIELLDEEIIDSEIMFELFDRLDELDTDEEIVNFINEMNELYKP